MARTQSIASLPCKIVLGDLIQPLFKNSFYHQGFFAVKRRAVFILGAMWWALVRGWRSDCVVGGMETCFQCRKAHNHYAKCEAFHFAPRLFFMFLFLIPFTIRQQCIIFPINFPLNRYAFAIFDSQLLFNVVKNGKRPTNTHFALADLLTLQLSCSRCSLSSRRRRSCHCMSRSPDVGGALRRWHLAPRALRPGSARFHQRVGG